MAQVFQKRLEEENEVRQADGLDIWREADGTPIIFKPLPKE
jgi:hypothetical protein